MQIILAYIVSLTSALPISNNDYHKEPVKRGIFDNISHFPFLASSSSAHGSSGSSSSSDEYDFHDYHHDNIPDFHSVSNAHVIHHPEVDGHDFLHSYDHDVPISYQNQYFGHDVPTSYHSQHLFDNHLSNVETSHDNHFNDFNKFDGLHDSLLELSNLDVPEYSHDSHGSYISDIDDYKNYGGDLADYTHHAGLLDISDDDKIDHLLDPYSPNHSSYDSY